MDEYEVNIDTLCVVPINSFNSMVYEKDSSFIVKQSTKDIINNSCLFYGSTYVGRKEACSLMLNSTYKVPIIIDESKSVIFFPTISDRNDKCAWISFNNCIGAEKIDSKNCKLLFNDNSSCNVNFSYYIIQNQLVRSNFINLQISSRKKA